MKAFVGTALMSAAKAMWEANPTLGQFAAGTTDRETNLCSHLRAELSIWFPWFDVDNDLIKVGLGNRRPDLVIHRRGAHGANFLALEVKRASNRTGTESDTEKIKRYWLSDSLGYRFGASMVLDEHLRQSTVTVFERSSISDLVFPVSSYGISLFVRPNYQNAIRHELSAYVDRLSSAEGPAHEQCQDAVDRLMIAAFRG